MCHVVAFKERDEISVYFFQEEEGIRDGTVTGVQTCALPICSKFKEDCEPAWDMLEPPLYKNFKTELNLSGLPRRVEPKAIRIRLSSPKKRLITKAHYECHSRTSHSLSP